MAYGEGHPQSSDGPTCLVALLAPFLVLCAIVGYATLDGGGITQRDEQTGAVQVLTWHGWEPAGEPARQLSAPPVSAYGAANPTVASLPTPRPAPPVVLVVPTVDNVALAPAAGAGDGTTIRYTGYSAAESTLAAPVVTAGLSPWALLGWILVILVPVALLVGIGLVVHRYLTTAKRRPIPEETGPVARAEALPAHLVGDAAAEPDPPAAGRPGESSPPAAPECTCLADFLSTERLPEMVAVGGTHDPPVAG